MTDAARDGQGLIFDIDTFAVHDGPGIRMAVYLKGCPLAYQWCHSPESRRPQPELIFVRDRCVMCGACARVCPNRAHHLEDGRHTVDRTACAACGRCASSCPGGALAVKGCYTGADDIVQRAVRLKPFFQHSNGGITLTGGEVTTQPEFARAILAGCRAAGIHTAIETAGCCSWEQLEPLIELADLVLYDLKVMDDHQHLRWTGVSNRQILANAARLAGRAVQIRVPLIPAITDTDDNLNAIFRFMRGAGLPSVALLAYNPSSSAKYEWLDLPYAITGEPQTRDHLERLADLARRAGIADVTIA